MKFFERLKQLNRMSFFNKNLGKSQRYPAFTLAEVLITLGIIGVVAMMTIPSLINNVNNMHYKTAYKKAYADFNQAFLQALSDGSLTPRTDTFDDVATASEWAVMKSAFKVTTDCDTYSKLNNCWAVGDKIMGNAYPNSSASLSFVDNSGRSWAQYWYAENLYLVDTNGFQAPNRFGKDRWMFTLKNADGNRTTIGLPAKVGVYIGGDIGYDANWCQYPPLFLAV